MGTTIILLLLAALTVFAVRRYAKTLAHGCCGAGGSTARVRVQDRDPAHYPYSAAIQVAGMTCANCKQRIENALNTEPGTWAEVDLRGGAVLIRMKQPLPEERLRLVIAREGYTVLSVRQNAAPARTV